MVGGAGECNLFELGMKIISRFTILWMAIFPIFRNFEWKTCRFLYDFMWKRYDHINQVWTGFHNLELKWDVITWNAKKNFHAFFCEHKFIDPSLISTTFVSWWHSRLKLFTALAVSLPFDDWLIIFNLLFDLAHCVLVTLFLKIAGIS